MADRTGIVLHRGRTVGSLQEHDGRIHLRYDAGWRQFGFPISLSLPLAEASLDAHPFFAGLLPEGRSRQRVCRQLRLPEDDDLGLLLAIGRDAAGALVVQPWDAPDEEEAPIPIHPDQLVDLVESQGQRLPAGRPRFSLAGAQDKVAVIRHGGAYFLPTAAEPSTHILKFETLRWVCFAEWVGHELARRIGLAVPTTTYATPGVADRPFLEVERYDRAVEHGPRYRVQQEDLTQALGLMPSAKYEQDGGPTLGDVAALLRRSTDDPIRDIGQLRDWQLLNYLIGNYDAHAKNLSLLYPTPHGPPRLAPFYDLICLEFLDRIGIRFERALAFFVGAKSVPEEIGRDDWRAMAKAIGVPPRRLLDRLRTFADQLPELARQTRATFAARHGDNPVYDRFEEVIADRCRWTLAVIG